MDTPTYPKIDTLYTRAESGLATSNIRFREFEIIKPSAWFYTEKIDGMNIRVSFDGVSVQFGGRTDNAQLPARLVAYLMETFTVGKLSEHFNFPDTVVTLFGEGYGPGIQKMGQAYGSEQRFCLFDVKVGGWWLEYHNVREIAAALHLPCAGTYSLTSPEAATDSVRHGVISSILAMSHGAAPVKPEGIVARTEPTLVRRNGQRVMWKLKGSDFAKPEQI